MKKALLPTVLLSLLMIVPTAWAATPYGQLLGFYKKRDLGRLETACQENLRSVPRNDELYLETLFFLVASRVFQGDFQSAAPYMKMFRDAHAAREEAETKRTGARSIYIDARFPRLYFELGIYYFETKDYKEAIDWLRKAKTQDPMASDPMLYFRLARSYTEVGDLANAKKYYLKQLELNPKEPSPYYNMACVHARERDKGKALEWLRKAVAAHPPFGPQSAEDPDFVLLKNDPEFRELSSRR
jgi:tetratricopeptide (TPR) repeat protein